MSNFISIQEEGFVVDISRNDVAHVVPDYEPTNMECIRRINKRNGYIPYKLEEGRNCMNADDFGPQRFSKETGEKLVDVYEPMDSTPLWEDSEGYLVEDTISGYMQHTQMDMDDLRGIYGRLKGDDLKWRKEHLGELKKLYVECADDAGEDKSIVCCRFREEVNDDDVTMIENEKSDNAVVSETEYKEHPDVGVSDETKTHMSLPALKFWKAILWYIGHYMKGGKIKALNAYKSKIISFEELKYILTMLDYKDKKWGWIVSIFSNINKQGKETQYSYEELLNPYPITYKPSGKEVNKVNKYRVLHFYEPFGNLKEGFLLSIDWKPNLGFHNKRQIRILGYEKAIARYYQEIEIAAKNGYRVFTKNVRKEANEPILYKDSWNYWLSNHEGYLQDMKLLCR